MIVVVDYGVGNLRSVQKGFEKVGYKAIITADRDILDKADGIVLPGVGAFKDAANALSKSNLGEAIKEGIAKGKPFLGICLGLHLLFTQSEEHGITQGLDIIPGRVVSLPLSVKIPHMGWNQIKKIVDAPVLNDINDGSYLYFVHSYHVVPDDKNIVATTTNYGIEFVSSIWKKNIFASQFHPEKSSKLGLKILKKFGEATG
ncbi:imidazole glycerol phosphate synthase subunit HisH [Candidatus Oleimmundimicrobium sp.]|uniref:imidazole glycerol phosphate synthase subunit HisH n=1 Tax=Candidatus Oleimmundimicrobium sp. TaxID=3060597 RepID=UPI0027266C68|nr:imidazole glycerol phosphate synthase subunit HisH [Candidatus Oleimmundimicrobium sp.]MDO8886636.1 imidazole glycerol phosphate synthase subunit HisH [Candidatus Oleimmundimicrobium sp.]